MLYVFVQGFVLLSKLSIILWLESDSSSDDAEDELSGRELEEASHLCGKEYRNFNARMRQSALKSAYYRPITSCCSTKYPASVDMDNSDLAKFLRNRDWQEDMNFSRTLSRSSTPRSPPLCGIQKKPCLPLSSNREPQKAKWKRRRGRVRFRSKLRSEISENDVF